MKRLLGRALQTLEQEGLGMALRKIAWYLGSRARHRYRNRRWRRILADAVPTEERFTTIFRKKMWGNGESVSGSGSSLTYTRNLRDHLPKLVRDYQVRTIFDAPCGDFNWMRHVLPSLDVRYIGADIVKELIESHEGQFSGPNTSFLHMDLIKEAFPAADLMICRDCLFHLSYRDTCSVLENFVDARIPYLLTTTHLAPDPNRDIETGDFRFINLFERPYSFPDTPLVRIDDWVYPDRERQMCLWTRSQVSSALTHMKNHLRP